MALIDKLTALADSIRAKTGTTEKLTLDQMTTHVNDIEKMPETIILVDESGDEIPAVLTEEEITITATANDIRVGTTAVTSAGVIEGTKEIPSYHTTEGARFITNGSAFVIPLDTGRHDFTKLQAIICPFSTSLAKSVAAEKIVIDENLYNVNSTDVVSVVSRDAVNKQINLGITNNSGAMYVLRYITYKEEY